MDAAHEVFVSYTHADRETARRFAQGLEREGFKVWWDATLRSGDEYDAVTERAVRAARVVVVLWSKRSVESRWVRAEATVALQNKTLMPVMIEPCQRPIMFELTHTAELSHWKDDFDDPAWREYVAGIHKALGKGSSAPITERAPEAAARRFRPSPRLLTLSVIALVAVAAILAWLGRGSSWLSAFTPARASAVSVAVLPFVNLSSDREQDYLADGLAEELLNQLAQIKGLRVIGRTSSFSFKGRNEDLRTIGHELGVNHLLEGSVRKSGDRLRITAQLINSEDGSHVWSKTFEQAASEVFAIQDEVAKSVAQALSVTLDVGAIPRAQGGTTNYDAYDRFLRARQSQDPAQRLTLLREAVAIDPTFSRAWVALYDELIAATLYVPNLASVTAELADVRARIQTLAPDAWWTHYMQVNECTRQRHWTECDVAARKMIAAAPESQYEALDQYGFFLMCVGRFREAVEYRRRARDAEPLSPEASQEYQTALDGAGLRAEADAESARGRTLAGYSAAKDAKLLWRML
ncbi:MAG TPA: TIR domain-containing protein, partial [Steroidobacteraceae bacterium]|nr:TIR domain-containing protein [Steroidobacteraceae bacterium]